MGSHAAVAVNIRGMVTRLPRAEERLDIRAIHAAVAVEIRKAWPVSQACEADAVRVPRDRHGEPCRGHQSGAGGGAKQGRRRVTLRSSIDGKAGGGGIQLPAFRAVSADPLPANELEELVIKVGPVTVCDTFNRKMLDDSRASASVPARFAGLR